MAGPVEVPRAEDLPSNTVTALQVRGHRVAVVHGESGFYALDHECSHQGGPLDDCVLRYPWHGARFDARIGEVLDGPAARPVRTYPVTVEDGMVTVAVDTAAAAATDPRAARRARLAALRAAARTRPEDHELTTELTQPAADGGPGAERTGSGGRGRVRDRGQWANGHHGPLKDSERIKTRPGRSRRLRAHRHHPRSAGVGAFSGADRGTRYRWYGSYTQRPEEDGFFMQRGGCPTRLLTAEQVEAVGASDNASGATSATSPTASSTGPASRTSPRSGPGWGP
jgi:3-phenylpropionate/trans-cinnamate dioxygenase ferredoxin component